MCGGRITCDQGALNYVNGRSTISRTYKDKILTHMKGIVSLLCGFNDKVVNYSLRWMLDNCVIPIKKNRYWMEFW